MAGHRGSGPGPRRIRPQAFHRPADQRPGRRSRGDHPGGPRPPGQSWARSARAALTLGSSGKPLPLMTEVDMSHSISVNLLNDMSTNRLVQGAGRLGSIAPPVTGTTATAAYRARGDGIGRQRIAELAD